ncbi:Receptor protein kinase TMK1 [Citrus sinensis]|uniref:Receptor protein kinase TMK1 n=1 Tax=Citrus sinensis TaxID=2711 RepID=A0ACB8N8G5_CITSI|nr:Receptor protein kinase TMK1 [Citrus sinensis]
MQDLKASFVIPKRLKWSDPDPCQWSHVICSDDGQVTNIELQDQNRKGTVPPILKKLSSMAVMYLENNQLRGPIPSLVGPFADISNLSTLEDLSLGHNKLTGIFPVSSFNNHPKLTTLNLTNNLLQGPTPRFNNSKLTVDMRTGSNCFCLDDPGLACDSRVNILLSIAESMGYPEVLAESRKGNDPCPTYKYWKGISCDIGGNITENVVVITDGNPDVEKESNSPGSPPGSGSKIQILGITLGSVIGDFCGLFVVGLGVFLYIRNKKSSETVPIQVLRPRICGISVVHSVDFGDMAIPIQVLRNATNNFSEENRLGRGGVGTVYKGELKDGTEVGVKRMELGSVTEQGIAQFESEITVLTKGTLGRHLFNWEEEGLEPLEWNTRLNIALDVARGDDMRVADFGLVRLVPENGKHSILTKVAGTFGYLAPEYIGRKVVDATHSDPEYIIHLATWFQKMHKNHDTFQMAIDKTIQLDEENLANVSTVAELGDHCCANEP